MDKILALDPGSSKTGLICVTGHSIRKVAIAENKDILNIMSAFLIDPACTVVIEDIKPYNMRITPQIIETCKWIGELSYRLRIEAGVYPVMIGRSEVKRWVFNTFPDICLPIIQDRITKKGGSRPPTFMYVDDKIVTECMKQFYQIPTPPNGRGYQFGLKTHAWQALGLATFFSSTLKNSVKNLD